MKLSEMNATTLSVGVLGGVAVWFTAEVIKVPVWVAFIAWASFAVLGGGPQGWMRSIASNFVGIFWGSAALIASQQNVDSVLLASVAVGIGSAGMVASSRQPFLALPAIVWGFASTVGITAVTGRELASTAVMSNPTTIAVGAMVVGASFGLLAETVAKALTRPERNPTTPTGHPSPLEHRA